MPALRHFHLEGHCYHTISTTSGRRPAFANPVAAQILLDTIQFIRKDMAYVLAYAVMPDHLHLLLVPRDPYPLSKVMQSVKGYSARAVNMATGTKGRLWQPEYYDRLVRGEDQLEKLLAYIHENPVKAGFVQNAEDYRFSSAWAEAGADLEGLFAG